MHISGEIWIGFMDSDQIFTLLIYFLVFFN